MTKTCNNCGSINPDKAEYCRNCGVEFKTYKENINNLIIQHNIDNEYNIGVLINNINWEIKYENIYLKYDINISNENLNENIEINTEIIKNNGEIMKKYRDTIFKTDLEDKYHYEKPLVNIKDFNQIKKIIIYPEKLNRRFGKVL